MVTTRPKIKDRFNAFCRDTDAYLAGAEAGPLSGLRFAAKDLFDIKGEITGAGNPDWRDSHGPAEETAWAVDALVGAGAAMQGKTITDEISRGIFGENAFYGTPTNPRAPDRVPGGSSSGSAAAVAGGLVDFALGTDTGGSVRVPASFCGLYGIRTTHGRVPFTGVLGQAPSFDTVGWLARDAATLARVSEILLEAAVPAMMPSRLILADDALAVADAAVAAAVEAAGGRLAALGPALERGRLAESSLIDWAGHQGALQGREAWETFADWIDTVNPRFSFEVADNILRGTHADDAAIIEAKAARESVRVRLAALTDGDAVVVLPTAPFAAPLRNQKRSAMRAPRSRMLALSCIAGMAGTPQLSLPLLEVDGLPVGLSLIAAPGRDELLIGFARLLEEQGGLKE